MPIKPGPSENEQEFISRCMSAENDSFPDEAQRYAVCKSKWDRKELSKQKFGDPQKRVQAKLNFERKYEGINLAEGGLEDACWEGYVAIGTKEMDGREVPNCVPVEEEMKKIEEMSGVNLADYPFDQCVLEQTDRYGSEEIAKKVCGAIKRDYGK